MKRKNCLILFILLFIMFCCCATDNEAYDAGSKSAESENGIEEHDNSLTSDSYTPTNTPTDIPTNTPTNTQTPTDTPTPTNTPTDTPTPTNTPTPTPCRANILALGDMLIHLNLQNYHDAYFRNIADELAWADIKAINQETLIVSKSIGISDYPDFGTDQKVALEEVEWGFNVMTCASNHTLDKGTAGILDSVAFWKEQPVTILGIYDNPDEPRYKKLEINGITFALFNYTWGDEGTKNEIYGLNGKKLPSSYSYLVDTKDCWPRLVSDVEAVDSEVDVVIVFPHWGVENSHTPSIVQSTLAGELVKAGADLIIGTHPHVVQPLEVIAADNGNKGICFYSLGNCISGQNQFPQVLGGMAKVSVTKAWDSITIEAEMAPTVNHQIAGTTYCVYMLEDYTETLAGKHRLANNSQKLTVDRLWELWNRVVTENGLKIEKNTEKDIYE